MQTCVIADSELESCLGDHFRSVKYKDSDWLLLFVDGYLRGFLPTDAALPVLLSLKGILLTATNLKYPLFVIACTVLS